MIPKLYNIYILNDFFQFHAFKNNHSINSHDMGNQVVHLVMLLDLHPICTAFHKYTIGIWL